MSADRTRPGRHAERTERLPCCPAWPGTGRWSHFWHLTWENVASAVEDLSPEINEWLRPHLPGRSHLNRIFAQISVSYLD